LGGGFGYLFRFSSQALSLSVVFRPLAQVGFWSGFCLAKVRVLSSQVALIGLRGFGQIAGGHRVWFVTVRLAGNIRFRSCQVSKIGFKGSKKVLASLRQVFWSGQFVQSRVWQVMAFARSASLPKSFISASQVIFFASVVVSFGWSNWVLPKSEFVVKCGQEGCGSGFWSRSLAQPENA
jgi:hypothetical protein